MTRLSVKWYVVIAAILDILLVARSLPAADSTATGREAANTAIDRFNTETSFRRNASQPLTAGGTPLYTLDRQQSDTVRISAPSSSAFLEILAQPAVTGDLAFVQISEDLNFDGVPDSIYAPPFAVSGICANGIITCTPGTWDQCQPYRWTADDMARVSLDPVPLESLGGCYCINRSCGSDLVWSNMAVILKDLGGGIAGVIQEKKANFVITEVRTDGPTISYYGRDTSTGNDIQGAPVSVPAGQTTYYADPAAMTGAAETEALNQAANPDSYYTMLLTSMADKGAATKLHSCTIIRAVSIDLLSRTCPDGQAPDPFSGRCFDQDGNEIDAVCTYGTTDSVNDLCTTFADDPDCSLQEETVDTVQTFRNFQSTFLVPLPLNRNVTAAMTCNVGAPPYTTIATRDWWQKKRTYRCTGNNKFDFTDSARRLDAITGSVDGNTLDQDRFDFADARQDPDTGVWTTDDHVLTLNNNGDSPTCEQVCKTSKPVEDTQAVPTGRTSDVRISNQSIDYLYRICAGGVCPAGAGETVIKGCQCLDEFAEAASIISVLNEAGKDMICSDGVRK